MHAVNIGSLLLIDSADPALLPVLPPGSHPGNKLEGFLGIVFSGPVVDVDGSKLIRLPRTPSHPRNSTTQLHPLSVQMFQRPN